MSFKFKIEMSNSNFSFYYPTRHIQVYSPIGEGDPIIIVGPLLKEELEKDDDSNDLEKVSIEDLVNLLENEKQNEIK